MTALDLRLEKLEERFWGFVETCPEGEPGKLGCWLWTGLVRKDGRACHRLHHNHRTVEVHTLAYLLANRIDIAITRKDFFVIQTCGTRYCVCPEHLEARQVAHVLPLGGRRVKKVDRPGAWDAAIANAEHLRALKRQAEARRDTEVVHDYVYRGMPHRRVMEKHGVDFETFCRVIESRGYRRIPRWGVEDPEALRDWRSVPSWAMLGDDCSLTE